MGCKSFYLWRCSKCDGSFELISPATPGSSRINLIVGDGIRIPVLNDSQDAVTSIFIFHELPPKVRRAAFREFARVLKSGGRLVLVDSLQRGDEPDYDGLLEVFPQNFHEPYYASYLKKDFCKIAITYGLKQTRSVNAFVSKSLR